MSKARKFISAALSVVLAAILALGIFINTGFSAAKKSVASTIISIDRSTTAVKTANHSITGNINAIGEKVNITYEVYADMDNGSLSSTGSACVKGKLFTIEGLRLKPRGNNIVITAETPDGKTDVKTVHVNYDSSSIKNSTLRNVAKVRSGSDLSYVTNNLLVFFEENTDDAKRAEIIETVNGKCVGYVTGVNLWQVEVEAASFGTLVKMADKLTAMDDVLYATYNLAQAAASMVTPVIPSDPWYNYPWSELDPKDYNWSVEAVQALSAWGYDWAYNHINVGIVDNGVQNDHEDLAGKIFFPDAASAEENDPTAYHGTHVAGIMGAVPNNSKGVTGILWDTNMYCVNWDVLVGTDLNLIAGLTETVQAGAKVVNFSLGVANDISYLGAPGVNTEVIRFANLCKSEMKPLLDSGYDFIVVQSAGNGQNNISQDAIYNGYFCSVTPTNLTGITAEMKTKINERIIIAGSAYRVSQGNFRQAVTSNAGSQVDLCAPGVDVLSCISGNTYALLSGTSMASPMVAAIAALTWSVNPALTGAQVRSIVLSNTGYEVTDNPSPNHPLVNTYNMVNAKLAVEAALATKSADYSAVNTAVTAANALNSTLYTPASWAALTAAVNAVDYNLLYIDQPQIDTMAQNINNAIAGLVRKTVNYTVEYRLNTADGSKLAADKTGSGPVTYTVTETAPVISGYTPTVETKNLQLALENNKIVFVYVTIPVIGAMINTYKTVNGELVPATSARAGDVVTVRVTPSTNFFCGTSRYVVMYDKNFYTLVGSNSSAFAANTENSYFSNTVTSYSGTTTSPLAAWPASFINGESSLYNFTSTLFNAGTGSLNGGYPSIIGGQWLFSFRLRVNTGATGSGRIYMDHRWTRTTIFPAATQQYLYWCPSGDTFSIAGDATMDYSADFTLADCSIALDTSKTVSFDLNGGTGTAPASQSGETGTAVTLPAQSGFSRQFYNFLGWAAEPDATQALSGFSIGSNDSVLYAVWSRVPVLLTARIGSSTVISQPAGFIFGLQAGITEALFESAFVDVAGNGRLEYTTGPVGFGTGTRVDLVDNETQAVLETYYLVIFGDTNGDGNVDSIDAGGIVDYENYMMNWDDITDAAVLKAADINGDGNVDSLDAGLIVDTENYVVTINQRTGKRVAGLNPHTGYKQVIVTRRI